MIINTDFLGMIGYSGYLAVIAGIAYDKFKTKTTDGTQIEDVTTSVEEAKQTFDDFLGIILAVIENKDINDVDTIAFIKNSIEHIGK